MANLNGIVGFLFDGKRKDVDFMEGDIQSIIAPFSTVDDADGESKFTLTYWDKYRLEYEFLLRDFDISDAILISENYDDYDDYSVFESLDHKSISDNNLNGKVVALKVKSIDLIKIIENEKDFWYGLIDVGSMEEVDPYDVNKYDDYWIFIVSLLA